MAEKFLDMGIHAESLICTAKTPRTWDWTATSKTCTPLSAHPVRPELIIIRCENVRNNATFSMSFNLRHIIEGLYRRV